MKASVYRLSHGVYLAVLKDRQIMRGSVEDMAAVLMKEGISVGNLMLGGWHQDAELLDTAEQAELRVAMTAEAGGKK